MQVAETPHNFVKIRFSTNFIFYTRHIYRYITLHGWNIIIYLYRMDTVTALGCIFIGFIVVPIVQLMVDNSGPESLQMSFNSSWMVQR